VGTGTGTGRGTGRGIPPGSGNCKTGGGKPWGGKGDGPLGKNWGAIPGPGGPPPGGIPGKGGGGPCIPEG